jgi:hypothetical protein
VLATIFVGIWVAGATVFLAVAGWLAEQFLVIEGLSLPPWVWPLLSWLAALLTAVPAYLLTILPRSPVIRATGRLWLTGALLAGLFGSARALGVERNTGYLLLLTLLAAGAAALLRRRPTGSEPRRERVERRGRPVEPAVAADGSPASDSAAGESAAGGPEPGLAARDAASAAAQADGPTRDGMLPFAIAGGLACLVPWLCLGALGSVPETVFALTAAAALGALAAVLLGRDVWPYFTGSRWSLVGLGGLISGVFLTQLAAGTGASGVHLAELLTLPPLAFAAAALSRPKPNPPTTGRAQIGRAQTEQTEHVPSEHARTGRPRIGRLATVRLRLGGAPAGVLIGLAAAGPLAFVQPVGTTLVINAGNRDIGFWALLAAGCTLLVAAIFGIGYGLGLRHAPRQWIGAGTALLLAAGGIVGYVSVGTPGFYGDQLFVVLRTQADLTGLDTITDLDQRRTATYHRLVDTAQRSQAPLRATLSRLHLAYTPYYLVNGIEVSGGPAVRAWLSTRSDVARVLLNPRLRPVPGRGGPISGPLPAPTGTVSNISMIKADQVWASGDQGRGIVIGTSDTGVDADHPALAGSFRGGDDSWFDPANGSRTPTDHNGHGTHTIGSALGRGGIGVAPAAQWIGCVNLDRDLGNPAQYLNCLQFMLAPFGFGGDPWRDGRPDQAADVLTNSWGCPDLEGCDRAALRPAVDALTAAGIFVVAAAGNAGPRCHSITDPPSPYPDTFTVGAVTGAGTVADFSSRGPVPGLAKPDLLAPGQDVVSALPGGGYGELSGTSIATPQVAGVVALMWSANPALAGDVPRTAAMLRRTATPVPTDSCGDAAGLVNADAAVRAARVG